MSEADKMFEKLGYIEHFKNETNEVYRTDSSHCLGRSTIFQYENKRILPSPIITMQELKAINKKCEELGWL